MAGHTSHLSQLHRSLPHHDACFQLLLRAKNRHVHCQTSIFMLDLTEQPYSNVIIQSVMSHFPCPEICDPNTSNHQHDAIKASCASPGPAQLSTCPFNHNGRVDGKLCTLWWCALIHIISIIPLFILFFHMLWTCFSGCHWSWYDCAAFHHSKQHSSQAPCHRNRTNRTTWAGAVLHMTYEECVTWKLDYLRACLPSYSHASQHANVLVSLPMYLPTCIPAPLPDWLTNYRCAS